MRRFMFVSVVVAFLLLGAGCAKTDTPTPPVSEGSSPTSPQDAGGNTDATVGNESQPYGATPTMNEPVAPAESAAVVVGKTITITANGFVPSELTATKGTTVTFRNDDTTGHWPASGVHPTHELCPGFDAKKPLAQGETYSFTFTETKTCPMHDHLNSALRGTIVVE